MRNPPRRDAGSELPSVYCRGCCQDSAALPVLAGAPLTAMLKAGSDLDAPRLSVAVITILRKVPVADGVQWSLPVATLKLAAGGLPVIDQVSASPSASEPEGVKE